MGTTDPVAVARVLAEIAAQDGLRRLGIRGIRETDSGIPFVVDHEEEAVLAVEDVGNRDRSGEHESVVVVFIGERLRGRSGIEVVIPECVRVVVAQEVEPGAVIIVGAALGDHVDLGRVVTVLGGIDAGLHLHFLDGVDGGLDHKGVEVHVGVVDAIERVVVEHDARAAHRDALVGAGASQPRAGLALGR